MSVLYKPCCCCCCCCRWMNELMNLPANKHGLSEAATSVFLLPNTTSKRQRQQLKFYTFTSAHTHPSRPFETILLQSLLRIRGSLFNHVYRVYSSQEEKKYTRLKISFLPRAPLIQFSRLPNNPSEGRGSHFGHRDGGRFIPFRRLFSPAGALAPALTLALTRPAPSGRGGQAPGKTAQHGRLRLHGRRGLTSAVCR